jgi:4-alpha-glucanotransferase
VLLHPTSLPGPGDAGVLGADARRWLRLLAGAGFQVWQTLPVGPVGESLSPYQSSSASAGNPRLIDPVGLEEEGWLAPGEGARAMDWPGRQAALGAAWDRFRTSATPEQRASFHAYWQANRSWLLPYGLFLAARDRHGETGWWHWPAAVRDRKAGALEVLRADHRERIHQVAFEQYLFDRQWAALRTEARALGIHLFGDIPIYVDLDSVDAWWHRRLFRIGPDGRPEAVSGVPPDYFSADGQVWGNPLYDWDAMEREGFRWWRERVRLQLRRFDWLRLDHFRGLEAYWEVPAGASTAREGCWREAPGDALLAALTEELARDSGSSSEGFPGALPLVAEDLGTITPAVEALRDRFGLPGMLILQFAFDGSPDNPYLPHRHREQAVVYTGTHDNDTLAGWYGQLGPETRDYVARATGMAPEALPLGLLELALRSPARLAMLPFQDLLGLGSEARMNTPGTTSGNWAWRFRWEQVPADFIVRWRQALEGTGRVEGAGQPAEPVMAGS